MTTMENLIETIRIALRDDAGPIARRTGLVACREILAVLEAATERESAPTSSAAPSNDPPEAPPAAASGGVAAEAPTSSPAPPTAPTTAPAHAAHIDPTDVTALFASLGKLPPEQLLDLAIARLRAALPSGTSVTAPRPLRFQLIPLHHLGTTK
jgi:hypothetical protein